MVKSSLGKIFRSTEGQLAVAFAIASGAFAINRDVLGVGILGYDSFPWIVASRIQSLSDFLGTFSEEMMDGRMPAGVFYRPMSNLSLATDHAIWGLNPLGYALTSLLSWCLTIVLLHQLVRRMLGGRSWVAPAIAALFYALHPSALAILPMVARRPEILVLIFAACALLVLPDAPTRGAWRRQLLAGCFGMLAMASKESGVLVVGLITLHQAFGAAGGGLRASMIWGLKAGAASVGPSLGLLMVRLLAIGTIGGYDAYEGQLPYLTRLATWGPRYLGLPLLTDSMGGDTLDKVVPATCGLALSILALVFVRSSFASGGEALRRIPRIVAIGLAWLLTQVILAAGSLHFTPRYALAMTFATALVLAGVAEGGVLAWRHGQLRGRAWSAATILVVSAVAILALSGSSMLRPYPELARASRIHGQLLEALAQRIASAEEHEVIELEVQRRVHVDSRAVDGFWILSPWGLQAWLDMEYPGEDYEVALQQRPHVPHADFAAVIMRRR